MQVGVRVVGAELAAARLSAQGKSVVPALRGALNTTATKARTERYVKPLRGTMKAAQVRKAMRVKRANTRRLNSRVIPSSSGVAVLNYGTWGYDVIDKTRARIWVKGPQGKKVAAGFVNPSSDNKLPWSTKGKQRRAGGRASLRQAMGPSVAYWFKQLSGSATIRWTNIFLQQEFERRVRRELAKG